MRISRSFFVIQNQAITFMFLYVVGTRGGTVPGSGAAPRLLPTRRRGISRRRRDEVDVVSLLPSRERFLLPIRSTRIDGETIKRSR